MGMPEGLYPIAHACLYLASAPKSNAVKVAWHAAAELIEEHGALCRCRRSFATRSPGS